MIFKIDLREQWQEFFHALFNSLNPSLVLQLIKEKLAKVTNNVSSTILVQTTFILDCPLIGCKTRHFYLN